MMAVKMNKTKVVPILLACPRVDLDTRDNYRRTEKERLRYAREKLEHFLGCTTDISNFQRIVEEGTEQASAVLEELVYSEESNLSQLRRIWDSGIIKEKIMDEMVRQLKVLANQIIFICSSQESLHKNDLQMHLWK